MATSDAGVMQALFAATGVICVHRMIPEKALAAPLPPESTGGRVMAH